MATISITPRHYLVLTSPSHVVEVWVRRSPRQLALAFFNLDFCNNDRFPI